MKNYYIKITVPDPYPKIYETTGKGSTAELAIKRALKKWRSENWKRRPLPEGTIYFKKI